MGVLCLEIWRAWLLGALAIHAAVAGNPDAKRLYDDLLSNYNKLVRPVVNTSDVLRVCIKLKLSQLIDVNLCFTAQFNEKTIVENAKTVIPSNVISKLSTALNTSASSTKVKDIQNSINTFKTDIESMKSDFIALVFAYSELSTSALATANNTINTLTLISSILNKINNIATGTSTSYTLVDLIDSVKSNVMYELLLLYNVMEINPIMKIWCAPFMDNRLDTEFIALTKTLSDCLTTTKTINENIATKVADFSNLIWTTKISISGCRMMTILCFKTVIIDTAQVNVKKLYHDIEILMNGLSRSDVDSFDSDLATCGAVVLANRVEAIRNITVDVFKCANK